MATSLLYNITQNANENTTNYLVRLCNAHRVNKACNGSLKTRGVEKHGIKILYPLHVTGFDALQEDDTKEAEITG